jgi:hypothetical protein
LGELRDNARANANADFEERSTHANRIQACASTSNYLQVSILSAGRQMLLLLLERGEPPTEHGELTSSLVSDLEPNPPSTAPPDVTPQVSNPATPTKHPQPELRSVELDLIPKKREPLNPAYAILAAAILSAGTAITATYLNIRSSERLQRERDRTDALQTKLNETSNAVEALAENTDASASTTLGGPASTLAPTTAIVPATAAPLPSIIVVLPSTPPTILAVVPSAKPEPKIEPKPEAKVETPTVPASAPVLTTTTVAAPVTVPTTTVSVPATTPAPVPAAAALPSTVPTTKAT